MARFLGMMTASVNGMARPEEMTELDRASNLHLPLRPPHIFGKSSHRTHIVYFWYYHSIDRFAVTKVRKRPPIEEVRSSIHYSGLEYHRYIPFNGLSLAFLNCTLAEEPREICFEINQLCNLSCPICIAGAGPHSHVCLSLTQFDGTLRKYQGKVMRITLTGGEPILHVDFLDFVRLALAKAEGVVIATNGYQPSVLDPALNDLKPLTVAVSLQGSRDVHDQFVGQAGAFDRALETVRRCLRHGHRVEVLTTAFAEAIRSLPTLTDCLSVIPINEHRINLVKTRGRVERKTVSWEDVLAAVPDGPLRYKLSVKRRDQPFLFVASNGEEERRYGSKSR